LNKQTADSVSCKCSLCAAVFSVKQSWVDNTKKMMEGLKRPFSMPTKCWSCRKIANGEQKEALVNGPRYKPLDIAKSIGWIVAKRPDGSENHMNATFAMNGVFVSQHLFKTVPSGAVDLDSATLYWMDGEVELKYKDCKVVGRDLVFFNRPGKCQQVPNLRIDDQKLAGGDEVNSVAFDSLETMKKNSPSVKSGRVITVHRVEGDELAEYSLSTQPGHCTSPVINQNGRLVGFHNAATDSCGRFIPLTEVISAKVRSQLFQ